MKVAIDVSPLYGQSGSRGLGMYTKNLLELLKKEDRVEILEFVGKKIPKSADLIHYPYFPLFFISLPVFSQKKFVVTVHDLTPLVFPKAYPPGVKGKINFFIQKNLLLGAKRIIADSENSKKDIVKFIDYPKEKIDVVYLAPANNVRKIVDKTVLSKIIKKYGLPEKFVLYVGDVNYNKNLSRLVMACRLAKIPLVVAGKQAVQADFDKANIENKPLIEFLKLAKNNKDVLRLGFVEKDELSGLYSLASVYCQPSLYEGFGLQILEAMVCGCPVVTSDVSSLPEVAGEAALMVDPYNVDAIAEGIKMVVKDKRLFDKMVALGLKQAGKFSWKKTAAETIKTYEKVLGK